MGKIMNDLCARCRQRPQLHSHLGCLCSECEDAIEGMTQAELDADYKAHKLPEDPS
jgi:hypothetical protein